MDYNKQIAETQQFADELLKRMDSLRWWKSLAAGFGVLLVGLAIGLYLFKDNTYLKPYGDYLPIAQIGLGGLGLFFMAVALSLSDDTLRIRRAKALADVSAYSALLSYSAANAFIDNLGQVVLSHISQFFSFVLTNVQRSSKLTTSMMTAGFVLIAAGVFIGIHTGVEKENKEVMAYVASGSGIILELLTSAILVFNRESVDLMNNYMKKLESFSQTLLALSLLDTSSNDEYKEYMRQTWFIQIVHVLSGPNVGPLITSLQPPGSPTV